MALCLSNSTDFLKTRIIGKNYYLWQLNFIAMLKKTLRYVVIATGFLSMFAGVSCNDDDTITTEISIYYKDRTLEIEDDVTSTSVKFTAYTTWYVTIDTAYSDWLSVNAYAGSIGSFTLNILTEMNDSLDERKGYVVINGESQSSRISVTQKGYQIITFKDPQFEKYCLDNFDVDKSGYVTSREAHLATEVNCPSSNIADLTGIEYFKNIGTIDVSDNPIFTLSLARSHELTKIRCHHCTSLEGLELGAFMTSLDYLDCSYCKLSSINIDSCTLLREMNAKGNDLKSLNVISNKALAILDVTENYNMTSLFVAEDQTIARLNKEESTRIVYPSEKIEIPDPVFRQYLLEQFDVNRDNQLDAGEAEAVKYIRCHGQIGNPRPIYSLEGLQYFPNIIHLDCSYCMISELDLVYNPKLIEVYCHNNENLQSVRVSTLSPLVKFRCSDCNNLTSLDLNKNTHLQELYAENCALSEINFTECASIQHIHVSNNKLTSLETGDCKNLIYVDCSYNKLAGTLSIKDRDSLAYVYCQHNLIETLNLDPDDLYDVDCGSNKISGELNLAEWKYLHTFACDSNNISSVTLPDCFFMTKLDIRQNAITSLDLSVQPGLEYVYAEGNSLQTINTQGCDMLERLNLRSNKFEGEISFSANRGLKILWIDLNPSLTTLYIPKGLEQFEYKVDENVEVIER